MFVFTSTTSLSFLTIFLISFLQHVSGFDCDWGGSKSVFDKINPLNPKSCPTLLDSNDDVFCCKDQKTDLGYCCNAHDFVGNVNMLLAVAGLIVAIVLVSVICCCCCPCCCVYKRRNGVVYGHGPSPGYTTVVTSAQQPAQVVHVYGTQQPGGAYPVQPVMQPAPYPQQQYAAYAAVPQPPTYGEATTQEMYTKQAPYNPGYQ